MNLLAKQHISRPAGDETVFRISPRGPLLTFLIFLVGLLAGIALFISCYQSSIIWGMVLSGMYTLILWGLCHVLFRALRAARSPANWLARIGPDGLLLKYRSYLHDDSPAEDPIALQLAWREILGAQLQEELYATTDTDGSHQDRRWFLAIKLDSRSANVDRIKSALEFENRRRPTHFKVDDLKHALFMARKKKAPYAEIRRIEQDIAQEKRRHPGKHSKTRFHHRPVVFVMPDLLKMEWTHITPGRKKLRQLLSRHTTVIGDRQRHVDIEKPMTEAEFKFLLTTLLSRDEKIEAVKLVRQQLGLTTTEAKAFIDRPSH